MKIVSIKEVSAEEGGKQPLGFHQALHLEPRKGWFMRIGLNAEGLWFVRDNCAAHVPAAELLRIAAAADDGFKPPA
jgi:hypothetical protein